MELECSSLIFFIETKVWTKGAHRPCTVLQNYGKVVAIVAKFFCLF